jgi:hypothetical protein
LVFHVRSYRERKVLLAPKVHRESKVRRELLERRGPLVLLAQQERKGHKAHRE